MLFLFLLCEVALMVTEIAGKLPRHHGEVELRDIENTNKKRMNYHPGHLMNLTKANSAPNQ